MDEKCHILSDIVVLSLFSPSKKKMGNIKGNTKGVKKGTGHKKNKIYQIRCF